ncbi:MAG: MBL fold metallo-hydrolase [Bacilli bacterium]|nr:MBL fold metallo-hydrolase [Bacilli bacterium]MBO6285738.1 MBL fold metallo-hydrolase [Bacilli bacterium]
MNALFLLIGSILGLYLGHSDDPVRLVIVALALVVAFFWAKSRGALVYLLIPTFICFGLSAALFWIPYPEGTSEFDAVVIRQSDNYVLVQHFFRRYYVSCKGNHYEVGDILHLRGKVTPFLSTTYESRFDFGAYLKDYGVRYELASPKIATNFQTPFRLRAFELGFLNHFSPSGKAMLDSLLFGKKDYSSSLIEKASSMNLIFVLSSSGMLYTLFLGVVKKVLCWKIKEGTADVVVVFLGLFFLPFGFKKIGILRAFLVRAIKLFNIHILKKELSYLSRLGIAGLVILLLDIHNAFNTGFLIGMGICLLMVVVRPYIEHKKKAVEKVRSSLVIRVFLIPLTLTGGGVHLFGMLFMFMLLPLSGFIVTLGYLSLVTVPFTGLFNGLGDFMVYLLTRFEAVDLAFPLPALSVAGVGIFYAVLFVSLFLHESAMHLSRNILVFSSIGLYVCSLVPIVPYLTNSVSFINVGQGDCALIQSGNVNVLIDTGGVTSFDIAEECLLPYFRKRRIYHLDAIIASHQDYDHMGGVETLLKKFKVGTYIKDPTPFPVSFGNLTFYNYNNYDATEENDKSLVLSLDFMGKNWIFTGDAPIWIEKKIIADYPHLDCDILKVGHHGSDTSTCAEWLDAITPRTAIISCGAKNKYGHPIPSVLKLLEERHIEIRRTDLEGTIVYSSLR